VADKLDAGALVASVIGLHPSARPAPGKTADWSSEPFGQPLIAGLDGTVHVTVMRGDLIPGVPAQRVTARLVFAGSQVSLEHLDAHVAGGELKGRLSVSHSANEMSTRAQLSLTGVDAAAVLPGDARAPVGGRLSARFDFEASGLSPKALVGSLAGTGTVTLENGYFSSLDPRAFATALRASDQGVAKDVPKIHDIVAAALDSGQLQVPHLETTVSINAGQARFAQAIAEASGARLAASGSVDLVQQEMQARLTLTGPARDDAATGRPDIFVSLKGPIAKPARSIDVSALAGWLTIRSIEQQARKLQELEAARRAAAEKPPATPPKSPAPNLNPTAAPAAPQGAPAAMASTPVRAAAPAAARATAKPAPAVTSKPEVEQAPPEPPPTSSIGEKKRTAPPEPRAAATARPASPETSPATLARQSDRAQIAAPPPLPAPVEIRRIPRGWEGGEASRQPVNPPLVLPSAELPPAEIR
jgi:large subunit ribosomal protein L24